MPASEGLDEAWVYGLMRRRKPVLLQAARSRGRGVGVDAADAGHGALGGATG